tara:strand:- start:2150 stop:2407 length:258 start_codon:yes stop_codon:yes gene_type:complete
MNKIKLFWNKFCNIFGIMAKKGNINTRHFSGSSVPVGSKIGKVLINSVDSRKISRAIRVAVSKGEAQTVKLSNSTKQALKVAKAH